MKISDSLVTGALNVLLSSAELEGAFPQRLLLIPFLQGGVSVRQQAAVGRVRLHHRRRRRRRLRGGAPPLRSPRLEGPSNRGRG